MLLHRLTFEAIGPYADRVDIDFTGLNTAGRFLLEGPTGVGKSTIIDAIVYALYGATSGSEGGSSGLDRLDSDFRDPQQQPFVELVFSTGSGTYRVRRSPEFERPRKRGGGTTREKAQVSLVKLADPDDLVGVAVSSRADEVGQEVKAAVGLSREQFVKTIVLPQGQFARFLTSTGPERKIILEKIFRTGIYRQLEDRLGDLRRRAKDERSAAAAAVQQALAAFRGAAGQGPLAGEDADPAQEVAAGLEALEVDAQVCADEAEHADRGARQARAHLEQVASLAERLSALRTAHADRRGLLERDAGIEDLRGTIAAAHRAECTADALAAQETALAVHQGALGVVAAARRTAGPTWAEASRQSLVARSSELAHQIGGLERWVAVESGLPARRAALVQLQQRRDAQQESARAAAEELAALPDRKRVAAQTRDLLLSEAALLPELAQRQEALVALAAASDRLLAERAGLTEATADLDRLAQLCAGREREAAELFARYLAGVAAEVGAALVEGEPCPACGSAEHPAPAVPSAEHVAAADVQQARELADAARDDVERARARVAGAAARVEGLEGQVQGRSRDQLLAAVEENDARVAAARSAATRLAAHLVEIAALEEQQEALETARGTAVEAAAAITEAMRQARESLEDDERALVEHRAGQDTVTGRAALLSREQQQAHHLAEALAAAQDAEAHLELARDGVVSALGREGFATAEQARAARRAAEDLQDWQAQVAEHDEAWVRTRATLARPELQGLDPALEVDLSGARAAAEAADRARDEALAALVAVQHRRKRAGACADEVRSAMEGERRVHATTAPVIRVAGILDGSANRVRMPLSAYVLLHQFDQVVAAANSHLRVMSCDAYSLRATEDKVGAAQRRGLGLVVVDHRTGKERPTDTLSGGETFYTSLALALGLAEAVQGQAGGLRLETLFVDEGFGTLDGDTLDDVLGVLDGLRRDGRVLGIISHVEDMKVRIPDRIEVRRTGSTGPSTACVVA
jgi:exonuclease SbcC